MLTPVIRLTKTQARLLNRKRQIAQLGTLNRYDLIQAYTKSEITLGQAMARAAGWEVERIEAPVPEPTSDVPPPPGEYIYDLTIAVKKYGYGSTSNAAHPILWWQVAGQARDEIYGRGLQVTLVDSNIQDRLQAYQPKPKMEIQDNQIIYRFKLERNTS